MMAGVAKRYSQYHMEISDVNEKELTDIGHRYQHEHLSPATFPSPPFPVVGRIAVENNRLLVPLVCKCENQPDSKAVTIWFLIVTGTPHTCLSAKSLEALVGKENVKEGECYSLNIQDRDCAIECQVSESNIQEVNILGMTAMKKLKLSVNVDWTNNEFELVRH